MKRILIGAVWFWGFWSFGSTLEFMGVLPAWPMVAIGAACAVAAAGVGHVRLPRAAAYGPGPGAQPDPSQPQGIR